MDFIDTDPTIGKMQKLFEIETTWIELILIGAPTRMNTKRQTFWHWWQPPRRLADREEDRSVTFLELFYDLAWYWWRN